MQYSLKYTCPYNQTKEAITGQVHLAFTRSKKPVVLVSIWDDSDLSSAHYKLKVGKPSLEKGGSSIQGIMDVLLYQDLIIEDLGEVLEEELEKNPRKYPNIHLISGTRIEKYDYESDTRSGTYGGSHIAFGAGVNIEELNRLLKKTVKGQLNIR